MAADTCGQSICERIPSTQEAVREVIDRSVQLLEQWGWTASDLFDIQLSLEEALANAVIHGNQQDACKSIQFLLKINEAEVRISICDEGEGFDPESIPDPRCGESISCEHGRGVLMMRKLMSEVSFEDQGNRVVMIKRRADPGEQPGS